MRLLLLLAACLALLAPLRAGAEGGEEGLGTWIHRLQEHRRDPFEQDARERAIRELGRIGGVKAASALLPLFEDPFVHLHDRAVRAWIEMLRGEHAAETRSWMTGRALAVRDPLARRGVAVALGLTSGTEIEAPLATAIAKEKNPEVLAALADAARQIRGTPDLHGALLGRLDHRDGRAAFHLALAAARVDGQRAVPGLLGLLEHRAGLARAGAVLALQELDALPADRIEDILTDKAVQPPMALAETLELRTSSLPWDARGRATLERLLAHASWRVRAAAVQGALRVWEPQIVPLLIDRLAPEKGRLRDDVLRALETFTGKDIGTDPDLWRAWWRQKASSFSPGPRPDKDQAGNIPFREGAAHSPVAGTATVAFFDLPLRTTRIAFVFDLSGSMSHAARKGSTEGPTKFDLLKKEFAKTLRALPVDTEFEVYVYRYPSSYPPKPRMTQALGGMRPARSGNARRALAWLEKQEPKGWGAFYEPLEMLLGEDVDTVVLLSDGRPSRGRYDRDVRILDEFPRADRFARMAVDTVLIGTKGADRKFMKALASATGGRFREVRAP